MPDVEKVIKGLECCVIHVSCAADGGCPYRSEVDANCIDTAIKDAIALLKAQEQVVMAGAELTDAELIEAIRKAPITLKPSVDAVLVVRCRDCVYGCLSKNARGEDRVFCENPDFEGMDYLVNEPDWYCADGERRESE
jgi:hypothetical protein